MNMLTKQAEDAKYFAPSIKELQYADANSKGVANALLAALGVSAAGYSAKRLFEGLAAARMSDEIKPSTGLQRLVRDSNSAIDNNLLYSISNKKSKKAIEELADEIEQAGTEKESNYKQAGIPINIDLSLFGKNPNRGKLEQSAIEQYAGNIQNAKFVDALKDINVNKALSNNDASLASGIHYDPDTLKTDSAWTKYISAPLAKLGPQSALPLAATLGGGMVLAPMLAKALVKRTDEALPKSKRESKFLDAAKKIYEDAAKELQDAGYKKEKDEYKMEKESGKKKNPPKETVKVTRAGGNPLTSLANLPTLAAAALLSYATYKGVKGFDTGMDRAKNDLAHSTQFLRGWKATNKLRDYDYNPMTISLADEPGLAARLKNEKDDRVKALLSDLKDSDDIEFNPVEVQRLSNAYSEIA